MKVKQLLPLIAIFAIPANAQEAKMPADAQQLATKLIDWEKGEREQLDKKIAEKKAHVATALEAHLTTATQNGDLDGALAIRKFIESLKAEGAEVKMAGPESQQESVEPFTAPGERWEGISATGAQVSFEVRRDGKLDFESENVKAVWVIDKTGENEYTAKEPEKMKDMRGWKIQLTGEDAAQLYIGNQASLLQRTKTGRR